MSSIELAAIDLNLLVAFEAIFATQSVTAAAQELSIGQPATSAALGRLRVLFEDELFVRVGRDMQPTAKALELAPGIAVALQQIRVTLEASQRFEPATARQTLAIGCSEYASLAIAPHLLQLCRQAAPGIDLVLIDYQVEGAIALLEQAAIAVVLGSDFPSLPSQAGQYALMAERWVGVCRRGHPAVTDGRMALRRFAKLPQVQVKPRRKAACAVEQALAGQNLQRRIVLTVPYYFALATLIADSDMVAAIPSRLANQFAAQQLVERFELPLDLEPWPIAMVWGKLSERSPACRWLRQTIRQLCETL